MEPLVGAAGPRQKGDLSPLLWIFQVEGDPKRLEDPDTLGFHSHPDHLISSKEDSKDIIDVKVVT